MKVHLINDIVNNDWIYIDNKNPYLNNVGNIIVNDLSDIYNKKCPIVKRKYTQYNN